MNAQICLATALLAILLPACSKPSSGDDATAGNESQAKGVEVWCRLDDGVAVNYLCWEEQSCQGSSPASICSLYWSGDVDHADLWEKSTLMGPCDDGVEGDGVDPPDIAQAPCQCNWGSVAQNDEWCDVPREMDMYDYPDGYPLPPGIDPTGGEDPTTGGEEPTLETYVCGDPLALQQTCVFYNHVENPLLDPDNLCWVDADQPNDYTVCLQAVDAADALGKCTTKCGEFLTHANGEIAAHVPADMPVAPFMDCVLNGAGEVPRLKTAADHCDPQVSHLLAWGGASTLRSFTTSMGLGTSSGGSTSNRELVGYLAYETTNCTSTQCDFTIDALEGVQADVSGIFTDAAGGQISYLIEDLDFRMTQKIHGILNLRSRNVVFPVDPFAGNVWTSGYSVAGTSMGDWASPIFVSQAVGRLRTSGELRLNLTFDWAGGVFTASFVTH